MSKYIVETYYTCSFKIIHKLDELNEKKLSDLENRNDGDVKIIDVKLNNRKTKIASNNKEKSDDIIEELSDKTIPGISSILSEQIVKPSKLQTSKDFDNTKSRLKPISSLKILRVSYLILLSCSAKLKPSLLVIKPSLIWLDLKLSYSEKPATV